jgi:hypothetical protein
MAAAKHPGVAAPVEEGLGVGWASQLQRLKRDPCSLRRCDPLLSQQRIG